MLIIDNLSLSTTEGALRLLFAPFGKVVRAQVARTRMGESLRFGFVEMEKPEEADFARRALDGEMFQSFALHISDAWQDTLNIVSPVVRRPFVSHVNATPK
ncbi:MAG: RNA-binding protein [Nitrospirota bacterium]|nr:RNA-binding protein [Nitrospirota bacterium]